MAAGISARDDAGATVGARGAVCRSDMATAWRGKEPRRVTTAPHEDDVEIADWQQVGLALGEPSSRGSGLALGAVSVAARVVGDPEVAAVVAAIDVAAQRRRPAGLNRRHDFQLGETKTPCLSETVAGTHGPDRAAPG
jgi:hypothetical protein